jgi:hypothetical protein
MNFHFELTMTFISGGGTGSVTEICESADLSKVKFASNNVGDGRQQDGISGSVIIRGRDYIAFNSRLNDPIYYVDDEAFTYKLYLNDEQVNTNKIKLTNNNRFTKELTFQLYDNAVNEYTNLFAGWNTEYNVLDDVSGLGNKTDYSDFRELYDNGASVLTSVTITSQQSYETYIQTLIDSYDTETPYSVTLGFIAGTTYIPSVSTKEFRAIGYKNGTTNEPPAGVDWTYDTDVSSQPRFIKAPKVRSIDYGTYTGLGNISTTINIEQEANIEYWSGPRDLQDIITYLVGKADSTIGFDANSFDGLDDVVGAGTFNGSNKFAARLKMMTVSDFIPTLAGVQKTNAATKGMLSLAVVIEILEQLGFYWYLEESSGTYYFRIQHITTVTFGNTNPDLTNLKSIDWTRNKRSLDEIEKIYDKVTNTSVSGDYNFRQPEFVFTVGDKIQPWGSSRIFTNIDHILDGKDAVCDQTSGEQWVLLTNGNDDVREFTSALNGISTNNYELSFYWITNNLIRVPGKYDKDGNDYDDARLQRKKHIKIEIPIDNPQTDFTFYDTVEFWGADAEIQSIERSCIDSMGFITLRYYEVL